MISIHSHMFLIFTCSWSSHGFWSSIFSVAWVSVRGSICGDSHPIAASLLHAQWICASLLLGTRTQPVYFACWEALQSHLVAFSSWQHSQGRCAMTSVSGCLTDEASTSMAAAWRSELQSLLQDPELVCAMLSGFGCGQAQCTQGAHLCKQNQDCAFCATEPRRGWLQGCAAAWWQVSTWAWGTFSAIACGSL